MMKRIRIEQQDTTTDPEYGTPVISWSLVAVLWAEVVDDLPSRSEAVRQGLEVARNRTRIRMDRRTDLDSTMRVVINRPTPTVYQIVGGPADVERGYKTEIVVERYSTDGGN